MEHIDELLKELKKLRAEQKEGSFNNEIRENIQKEINNIIDKINITKEELETKEIETNGVIAKDGRAILNTTHYAVEVKEDEEKLGIIIDVFHRHGDLIDSYTYWNDDVIDKDREAK